MTTMIVEGQTIRRWGLPPDHPTAVCPFLLRPRMPARDGCRKYARHDKINAGWFVEGVRYGTFVFTSVWPTSVALLPFIGRNVGHFRR